MSTSARIRNPFIGILLVIVAAVILLPKPQLHLPASESTGIELNNYADIPLTDHALNGHANQKWNALSIRHFFAKSGCEPKKTLCEEYDYEVHRCEVNGGKSIALVIGHTLRQIITGYMADTAYWANKCSTPIG